jgi:nucleoside-diphosphate-sugar epimerase/dTDP-glucose pyrophosphorylase
MKNILIVGGAGFIGSHLAEELSKENNVVVVDNLFLGSMDNLEKIKEKIKFYNQDYTDGEFMKKIIVENNIDYIYHFGGFSSAPMFDENESKGYDANISGFASLLRACLNTNVKRVLYASSSSIYGSMEVQEESMKVFPPNFYSITKYAMEHTARLFHEMYGLESIGFRFFSVYGKNEKHKKQFANLISQFLWDIQEGRQVIIYGDGTQTRDFTYVDDIVFALSKGMEVDGEFAKASYYNVGTSETHNLNELVKILEDETGKKANVKYIENPIKNYVKHTKASTGKIERDFGFKSKFSLREGIKNITKTKIKAVILAGGSAKRLYPLTEFIPKPLLPVRGKPIISYILEKLKEIEDVGSIYLSVNKEFENHFKNYVNDFSHHSLKISVDEMVEGMERLGSLGGLYSLIKKEGINDDIMVIGGDNLFDYDIEEFIKFFKERKSPVLACFDVKDINQAKNFGVAEINEGKRVIGFEEKPENPKSTMVGVLCCLIPRRLLKKIPEFLEEGGHPDHFGSFIQWLHKKEDVYAFPFEGKWFDIGMVENYKKANEEYVVS